MSKRVRKPVVHASELDRALTVLRARGVSPAALDLLPGGALRLHLTAPAGSGAPAPAASDDDVLVQEEAAWATALQA